jgi:hypothetical protein
MDGGDSPQSTKKKDSLPDDYHHLQNGPFGYRRFRKSSHPMLNSNYHNPIANGSYLVHLEEKYPT